VGVCVNMCVKAYVCFGMVRSFVRLLSVDDRGLLQ